MEFKAPYLRAMRDRAPRLFNQLRRSGLLEKHLRDKSAEAHRMFDELTANLPKPLTDQQYREAERQVLETLIVFPSEAPEPSDPLAKLPDE